MSDEYTGIMVALLPAETDPVVAASSEPAHLTLAFLGDSTEANPTQVQRAIQEVESYAQSLDGPVVAGVQERGTLGDNDADVAFLEATDSLTALRGGLLGGSPALSGLAEQFDKFLAEWRPHVTLGYPETPADGDYSAEQISFDRIAVWVGDEHHDFTMGGAMDDEMPDDELEEGEELIDEIPVHGVATLEGKPTGDGRQFDVGALSFASLPQPLGYEFESSHGGGNSRVAFVGRIDEFWTAPSAEHGDGVFEARWRGVIFPAKQYAAEAIEGIIDGSFRQVSVIVDSVTVNVDEQRADFIERIRSDQDRMSPADGVDNGKQVKMSDEQIEELVDAFIGDGTTPITRFSAARIRRFDMIPTGAYEEGYVALGHEFEDELSEEQLAALAACGCSQVPDDVVDLSSDVVVVERENATGTSVHGPFESADAANEWITTSGGDGEFSIVPVNRAAKGPEDSDNPDVELGYDSLAIGTTAVAVGESAIAMGHYSTAIGKTVAFAPGTKDGPGWITNPVATARIRRYWTKGKGAAKIRWGEGGDFNRCRKQLAKYVQNPEWLAGLCANMHREALGIWPSTHAKAIKGHSLTASAARSPLFVLTADASVSSTDHLVYPADAFLRPPDEGRAYALRIDRESRRIYGYAAAWGSCHVGIEGLCQEAPHSATDYSFFRKGVVDTDQGEQRVGLITYGIGHASQKARAASATAHYDQTDAVRAYINIGEDVYGIWFAGVLAPWVDDSDIDAMRAIGRVSGDWRNWSGMPHDLEMVGLVVVNTEGFQLAASGGVQTSAIGIGSPPKEEAVVASGMISVDDALGIALAAAEEALHRQKRDQLASKAAPARAAIKARTLATARATIEKER
jgi:2'-5' RNA ligase